MFEIVRVKFFGGSGGLTFDAVPIYGSPKAPFGTHYPLSSKETNPFFTGTEGEKGWLHIRDEYICGAKYDFETGEFEVNDRGYTRLYEHVNGGFRLWSTKSGDLVLYPYAEASHLQVLDVNNPPEPPTPPAPKKGNCDGMYRVKIARLFPLEVYLERIDEG